MGPHQEGAHKFRNVFLPLAQGRHEDPNHIDPVEKVFTKAPFIDQLCERLTGGGNDARAPGFSHEFHKLCLGFGWQVTNFIKIQRRFLVEGKARLGFGTKQVAADLIGRHGSQIECLELSILSTAELVYRLCGELLAGS